MSQRYGLRYYPTILILCSHRHVNFKMIKHLLLAYLNIGKILIDFWARNLRLVWFYYFYKTSKIDQFLSFFAPGGLKVLLTFLIIYDKKLPADKNNTNIELILEWGARSREKFDSSTNYLNLISSFFFEGSCLNCFLHEFF